MPQPLQYHNTRIFAPEAFSLSAKLLLSDRRWSRIIGYKAKASKLYFPGMQA